MCVARGGGVHPDWSKKFRGVTGVKKKKKKGSQDKNNEKEITHAKIIQTKKKTKKDSE